MKKSVADALVKILRPVHQTFQSDKEWKDIEALAYPKAEEPAKKKKVKKVNPRFADKVPVSKGGTMPDEEAAQQQQQQPADTPAGKETTQKAKGSDTVEENQTFVKGVEGLSVNDQASKDMEERRQAAQGGNKEEA